MCLRCIPGIVFYPLTAVSRGSGYKFFVTMYHEPGDPDKTLHAKTGRQTAAQIERYMQMGTVSRRPGYTHIYV